MKKTLNINLGGYPFIIDDDAYRLLKDYLDTIRYAFDTKEDTEDLATDIENRIAEILIEKEDGGVRIVTAQEISEIIERIGKPSEFIEVDETIKTEDSSHPKEEQEEIKIEEERATPPPYNSDTYSRNPFARKKIFRDPQNAMLGGVCSGIAAYLHVDVTIVRLITVILFFLSASTVAIAYIILWIVVPEARTPYQRMQMMGKDPTVENIGKTVTENYQDNEKNGNVSNSQNGVTGFLSTIFSIFVKILIFLGLVISILVLIPLAAGFVGCIAVAFAILIAFAGGIISGPEGWFDTTQEGWMVFFILLAVIGGIITVGIPIWLLLKTLWRRKDNRRREVNLSPYHSRVLLVIWLCGIALLAVFTVKAVKKAHEINHLEWELNLHNLDKVKVGNEDIEKIRIDREGVNITTKEGNEYEITKEGLTIDSAGTVSEYSIIDKSVKVSSPNQIIVNDSVNIEEVRPDTIK